MRVQAGKWEPFVVKDGQLITGQNPRSSEKLAHCVLETLKPGALICPNAAQTLHACTAHMCCACKAVACRSSTLRAQYVPA